MTTNSSQANPNGALPQQPQQVTATPKPPPRVYTTGERILVPVALSVAVLYDRLVFTQFWRGSNAAPFFSAIFWLLFLGVYYTMFWKRLAKNRPLWLVGGLTALLCAWNFFFDYRSPYGWLTYFVIPLVLMAHTQLLAGGHRLKEVGLIATDWVLGWVLRPFSAIPMLFGAAGSAVSGSKKTVVRKSLVGLLITVPIMVIVVPLMTSADMVFRFYLENLFRGFNLASLFPHLLITAIALMLFYSFFWNIGYAGEKKVIAKRELVRIDSVVTCIVLGAVSLLYLMFCMVQFTYLFAGAGLPGDMTYSEYAREGFGQILVICGLNLALFGTFLQYGRRHKLIVAMLAILLGLTAVMLVSSFVRLKLYIDAYGLTWLRLLSAWFIVYLGAVIVLCYVRMAKEQLPLLAVCSFVLLGWYVALGYTNPDGMIIRYNLEASENPVEWVEQNRHYISQLSDNGKLTLLQMGVDREVVLPVIEGGNSTGSHSLSSSLLNRNLH